MNVGILKPDHLGDMVLAAPAIAAIRRTFPDPILLCQPRTTPLAEHLFPGIHCEPILLPHLDKDRRLPPDDNPLHDLVGRFDLLLCLRWDATMGRLIAEAGLDCQSSGEECFDAHVAVEQRRVIEPFTGPYDLLTSYRYPCNESSTPFRTPQSTLRTPQSSRCGERGAVRSVGLCISAGFPLNAWPLNHWLQLGERLHERNFRVALIGGPAEAARLRVLADALTAALGYQPSCLVGTADFGALLRAIAAEVDLVIATDSGTAHLAALVKPIISLFGGTPWRRYAPLGPHNMVISRLEPCSPCRQFDRTSISTCHSQECLTNLFPEDVIRCLDYYLSANRPHSSVRSGRVWMLRSPWLARRASEEAQSPRLRVGLTHDRRR